MQIKKVVIKIQVFGQLFRTTVVFMAMKSYNHLKFLNSVTMATTDVYKPFLMLIMMVVKKYWFLENYLGQLWFSWQQYPIISSNS